MNDRLDFLRDKSSRLPAAPGVYLMKDKSGTVIYVGKAKLLKNRVSSYFHGLERHAVKTYKLVDKIYDFDFIVTQSELDALVLESTQIKLRSPKYNILLKDAKGANYIKISGGDYPRLTYALQTNDKSATYLGPYAQTYTSKELVNDVNRIFLLPTCTRKFPQDFGKERPCLNFHIKRCVGVCRGNIGKEEYARLIKSALDYIKSGSKQSIERLTAEMNQAAEDLAFERAARIRDQLNAITRVEKSQKIQSAKLTDYDLVALAQNIGLASVAVIKYRGGILHDKENFFIGDEYEPAQMRADFLVRYYESVQPEDIPKEIYLDLELAEEDESLLAEYIGNRAGHKVSFVYPKRGEGLTQITLTASNAEEYLALRVGRTAKEIAALDTLTKLLGLPKTPLIIESYDISNTGEQTIVGGMIVYRNGRPFKADYRKFTIKTVEGIDDYASMREVVGRRFARYLDGDENFAWKPDLILLDGGQGHVNAVGQLLNDMKLGDIPLFGLVKDEKHRTRAIASGGGEIQVSANKQAFTLLTQIQDEVHRFAITFQRKQHTKQSYDPLLTKIPGIGEKKAIALMTVFKTKQALKSASIEELRAAAKITEDKARELQAFLREHF
jgi:excinuclease ABC subunit C